MTLTITHTSDGGTLLDGTTRRDGAIDALCAAGFGGFWRWGRSIGMWYVPHSRDRAPRLSFVDATAAALRAAGFEVLVEIDAAPRPMADAERDRAGRMRERAEILHAVANRRRVRADGHEQAAGELADLMPLGQPVLVGHHSERRHRRDLERIERHSRASIELSRDAASARHREQLRADAAHLDEQLRHWRGHLADLQAANVHVPVRAEDVGPGDLVRSGGRWERVVKVNTKTVRVEVPPGWRDTLPLSAIDEYRRAPEVPS